MDFLIRHYEKLILVVCLLLLLWSLHVVSQSQAKSQDASKNIPNELQGIVKSDNLVEELNTESFESLDSLLSGRMTQVSLLTSPNGLQKSGLLEGGKFVVCKKRDCGYILPFNTDVCPWCKTPQEVVGPETLDTDDLDMDGIPDLFEKDTTFLHYRYRFDAMEDFDGDGFTNLEEYRAGTELDNEKSRPALAYLLRVEKASQNEFPLTLNRIKQNGSSDSKDWKASFRVDGDTRTQDVKLGGVVPKLKGYTLTEFSDDMQSVTISNGNKKYTLVAGGERIKEESYAITLRFLGNHIFRGPERKTDIETLLKEAEPDLRDPREIRKQQQQEMLRRTMGNGMMAGQGMTGNMMDGQNFNSFNFQQVFDVTIGDIFALKLAPTYGNSMTGNGGMSGMSPSRPSRGASLGMGGDYSSTSTAEYFDDETTKDIIEYYQLLEIVPPVAEGAKPIIRVQQLVDQFGTPKGEPIEIQHLDTVPYFQPLGTADDEPNHDYMPQTSARGGNGFGMEG
ncbi:MAG: hypothetical protein MJ106_03010 [Lentisphaeria bacterium]|nr:hypothetical protein [Lentisphaeria bacterium]